MFGFGLLYSMLGLSFRPRIIKIVFKLCLVLVVISLVDYYVYIKYIINF
jgi:hypothetical protein